MDRCELKDKYKYQIKWLNKNGSSLYEKYDSEENVKQDNIDADGSTYKEIFLQHTCAAVVGSFCLDFNHLISSTIMINIKVNI